MNLFKINKSNENTDLLEKNQPAEQERTSGVVSNLNNNANSILNMEVLSKDDFGPLKIFIDDDNVTDINWNGKDLWIDDVTKGRYCSEIKLEHNFLMVFAKKMSNVVSKNFNKFSPILEAETDDLRISIINHEISNTGTVVSIRKIPKVNRLSKDSMMKDGYCDELLEMFLGSCVTAKMNIMVGGLPGVGKTELIKYLARYIKDADRTITIEDTLELHLAELYPKKDIVELKTTDKFEYPQGIKAAVRLLAEWILISEIRCFRIAEDVDLCGLVRNLRSASLSQLIAKS